MEFKNFPREITVDESFDEFNFWCKLLGTSQVELANMPEQEIRNRMDRIQEILMEQQKRDQIEQQNRLKFLRKLNSKFQDKTSRVSKEDLNTKMRQQMCSRGGSDIVNILNKVTVNIPRKHERYNNRSQSLDTSTDNVARSKKHSSSYLKTNVVDCGPNVLRKTPKSGNLVNRSKSLDFPRYKN